MNTVVLQYTRLDYCCIVRHSISVVVKNCPTVVVTGVVMTEVNIDIIVILTHTSVQCTIGTVMS